MVLDDFFQTKCQAEIENVVFDLILTFIMNYEKNIFFFCIKIAWVDNEEW